MNELYNIQIDGQIPPNHQYSLHEVNEFLKCAMLLHKRKSTNKMVVVLYVDYI